jgi:hypothetical protein
VATTIFAANESQVLINGKAIEGVRGLEYRKLQARENVYGLGTQERIGLVSGAQVFEGRLHVASTSQALDQVAAADKFQLSAVLVHGTTKMTVTFDECYLLEKSFNLNVGSFGEAVYTFSATRGREELA